MCIRDRKGADNLTRNDGNMSNSKIIDLGNFGPIISDAADKITTYKILFVRPNSQKNVYILLSSFHAITQT